MAKKKATATATATATRKVNKSEAIREYLKAHPTKMPKEVAEDLTAKGIPVSAQMVSTIKSKGKVGKRRGRPGRKPGRPTMKSIQNGAHSALDSAFEFVGKVGGLLHAQDLIDRLKTFKERL
ncbi:MAG TPA: hypothetical protein VHZ24_04235 [Pirellulales bacterium]|jgi:hypothetical protein|nr:hypothetical protein [Pirellulales bacterium]